MKNEITISELARIMNVSVHQIRYFEEKGIFQPAYIDDNQYRMYSIEQIYELSHILLLRRLGVSVSAIKDCLTAFTTDQYQQLLRQSLLETNAQIRKLLELQAFIQKVLREQHDFASRPDSFQIKRYEPVRLMRWLEMDEQTHIQARQLAEQARLVPDLFETDVHYLYDGSGTVSLCLEAPESGNITLPGGSYLTFQGLANGDAATDQLIERFYEYLAAQSLVATGPLVLIEKSYLSLFSGQHLHYELRVLLDAADL
ncbi:MerR family transcriptional regulator [Brevibacillus sp. FSL K6-0770]|uniref:MerR family transcriptional regulator n=1 Tax=Brevibacillus sp. FSL K6-0770 TaxID=2954673 RepID=UPI0030F5D630